MNPPEAAYQKDERLLLTLFGRRAIIWHSRDKRSWRNPIPGVLAADHSE
jgi:hypothetical protein